MIVDFYARRGYQFLALSDHNTLSQGTRWVDVGRVETRAGRDKNPSIDPMARYRERFGPDWVETRMGGDTGKTPQVRLKPLGEYRTLFERPGQFLLIQGEEITDRFETKPIHMNASNLAETIKPQGGTSVPDVMERNLAAADEQAKRLGQPILTHVNHPNFGYAITAEELAMVTREQFFEVYNGHPDVHHTGDATHVGIERMWDIINTLRIGEMNAAPVYGLANDDSHHYHTGNTGSAPGRGWIQVRARFLTPEAIIHALETGDFYASSGVTLQAVDFDTSARTLTVAVAPEAGATYRIEFVGTRAGYDRTRKPVTDAKGQPLAVTQRYSDEIGAVLSAVDGPTGAYTLQGDELYVRAVVTSSQPPSRPSYKDQLARAWTQPVGWPSRVPAPPASGAPAP
jgi:hypothetical protein